MVDMNDFELRALGSRCYDLPKATYDMDDFGLWAQGSGWHDRL